MIREKLYELKKWKGVVHTTWDPRGRGVVRIHMVPPKFSLFSLPPALTILNGQDILPLNESWAILLTEFIENVNAHGPGTIDEEEMERILGRTFEGVRRVYPGVPDERLRDDITRLVDLFWSVARGEVPDEDIGYMTMGEYAPYMRAPHRMDLMVSSLSNGGKWKCNLKCVNCYAAGQTHSGEAELPTAEWKKIIGILRKAGIPQLTFTGGEPTLRADLPELVGEARWFVTRLNTNGLLMNDELCARLVDAELDSAQFTLYSHHEDIHDSLVGAAGFKKTVEGIRNALKAGINLSVNTPLCSANADYSEMLAFLKEMGVQYVTCSGMIDTGNARGEEARVMRLSRKDITKTVTEAAEYAFANDMEISFTSPGQIDEEALRSAGLNVPACGAALSNMAITPGGMVVPCQSWLTGEPLGDIRRDPWKKIWMSPRCGKIREISAKDKCGCQLSSENGKEGCAC